MGREEGGRISSARLGLSENLAPVFLFPPLHSLRHLWRENQIRNRENSNDKKPMEVKRKLFYLQSRTSLFGSHL